MAAATYLSGGRHIFQGPLTQRVNMSNSVHRNASCEKENNSLEKTAVGPISDQNISDTQKTQPSQYVVNVLSSMTTLWVVKNFLDQKHFWKTRSSIGCQRLVIKLPL